MKWLWSTMMSVGLAIGLSLTASVLVIPHAAASSEVSSNQAASNQTASKQTAPNQTARRPEAVPSVRAIAATPVRAQTSDSPRESDDRGSPPVFEFVCALIGFAVIVYVVMRRMRTPEPSSNQPDHAA